MKKSIFLFCFLLFSVSLVKAQNTSPQYNMAYWAGFAAGHYSMKRALEDNPLWSQPYMLVYYTIGASMSPITIVEVSASQYASTNVANKFIGIKVTSDAYQGCIMASNSIFFSLNYYLLQQAAWDDNATDIEKGSYEGYRDGVNDIVLNPTN